MSLLRRLRATVVIGLAWSLAWVACSAMLFMLFPPRLPVEFWRHLALESARNFGIFGFFAGTAFALTLRRTARGRDLGELSLSYAARWGAVAGVASVVIAPLTSIVVTLPALLMGGAVFAVVGVASAMTTLAIARRGVTDRLPDSSRALGGC